VTGGNDCRVAPRDRPCVENWSRFVRHVGFRSQQNATDRRLPDSHTNQQHCRDASGEPVKLPLSDNTSHARAGVLPYRREYECRSWPRERRESPDPGLDASSDGPLDPEGRV
jgi:hypothetical protein